jgi:DNA-binding MarR family transcriptional regulator
MPDCLPQDSVDRLLADWQAVEPELDFSPLAVIARLQRVRSTIDGALDRVFSGHGLSAPVFAVLVTLARLTGADGVTQRRLMAELGLTSGTVSVRIGQLVDQGLVTSEPDAGDRRNTRVALTPAGRALFERVVPAHLENERRLLAALSSQEREQLARLLQTLLVAFEGSGPAPGERAPLGMTVASAHVTIAMRAAVGLAGTTGLLVRSVDEDRPAQRAGLRAGDVLVRAGRHELRSIAGLNEAIDDAAAGNGRLRVLLLRGSDEQAATIRLPTAAAGRPVSSTARGRAPAEHAV